MKLTKRDRSMLNEETKARLNNAITDICKYVGLIHLKQYDPKKFISYIIDQGRRRVDDVHLNLKLNRKEAEEYVTEVINKL